MTSHPLLTCLLTTCVVFDHRSTVFAYGQTGSGKTHSMMGPHERGVFTDESVRARSAAVVARLLCPPADLSRLGGPQLRGVIPRIVDDIFDAMVDADEGIEFTAKVRCPRSPCQRPFSR